MDKYAQINMFNHDHWLQVYMFAFMWVDTDIIAEEDYFPTTKTFFENYKIGSTPGPLPKH